MKYVLIIVSIIVIILTMVIYFKLMKEVKNNKQISKDYLIKKVNTFSILLGVLFILTIISIGSNIYKAINEIRVNEDITKYNFYISEYKKNDDVHSKLDYFPKEIEKDKVISFGEYNRDGLFDGSYFIYLDYKYDDISEEINKIKDKSIKVINEVDSVYTIYVISDDGNGTQEYVLVNYDTKEIIYVFNQLFTSKEISINEDYFLE